MIDGQLTTSLITGLMAFLAAILVTDVGARRIPNQLVLIAILVSLAIRAHTGGPAGLADGVLGGLVGLGLFLPFYIAGGMGAGDVKGMAACGCFLGPGLGLLGAGLTLIGGGLIAAALLVARTLLMTLPLPPRASATVAGFGWGGGIPYAAAMVVGCLSAVLLAGTGNAELIGF